jgi:hypothetical protein
VINTFKAMMTNPATVQNKKLPYHRDTSLNSV